MSSKKRCTWTKSWALAEQGLRRTSADCDKESEDFDGKLEVCHHARN